MASKDGHFGYEMEIIPYPGSGIEKAGGIKGKTLVFSFETSNSGFKARSSGWTLIKRSGCRESFATSC